MARDMRALLCPSPGGGGSSEAGLHPALDSQPLYDVRYRHHANTRAFQVFVILHKGDLKWTQTHPTIFTSG
jgi:hypothetical protein